MTTSSATTGTGATTVADGGRSTATGRSAWAITGPTTTGTTDTTRPTDTVTATTGTATGMATLISRVGLRTSRWARLRCWLGVRGDTRWCRGAPWLPGSGAVEAALAAR